MITVAARRMTAAISATLVIRLHEGGPATYDQLCAFSGLSKRAMSRWIASQRIEGQRRIYIAGYAPDRCGRPFVPIWAWGNKPDAQRPGDSKTDAQRMKDMRAARKVSK